MKCTCSFPVAYGNHLAKLLDIVAMVIHTQVYVYNIQAHLHNVNY